VRSDIPSHQLLKDSEPDGQSLSRFDLVDAGTLHQGPMATGVDSKLVMEVFGVFCDREDGAVGGHVQGVHDPCPGSGDVGAHFGSAGLHVPAIALNQDSGPRQILSYLEQAFVRGYRPGPVAC
jgi:hypothetical protein